MARVASYKVRVIFRGRDNKPAAATFTAEGSRPAVAMLRAVAVAERFNRGRARGINLIVAAAIVEGPPGFIPVSRAELALPQEEQS